MPDASVVVPARNAAGVIGMQLEALARQETRWSFEVVVVDNCSTDDLAGAVAPFIGRLQVRIVPADDRPGVSYARNSGVAASEAPLILFCDADDVVGPTWVEQLCAVLDENDLAGGVLDTTTLNPARIAAASGLTRTDSLPTALRYLPYAFAGCMGVRRESFLKVGGFEEAFHGHEEADLSWRLQAAGATIGFAPDAVVNYRLGTDPMRIWRMQYRSGRSSVQLQAAHVDEVGRPGPRSWTQPLLAQAGSARQLFSPRSRLGWLGGTGWALGRAAGALEYFPPRFAPMLRTVKHRGMVARKNLVGATRPQWQAGLDVALRASTVVRPLRFDAARYPEHPFLGERVDEQPPRPVPRTVYALWTGDNRMSANRLEGLASLRRVAGVEVRLVTAADVGGLLVPGAPLHPAYQSLSLVHRADYLRCYLMHHHGGGYADIKRFSASWRPAFQSLSDDPALMAAGYHEWRSSDVAFVGGRLERDLRRHYRRVLGNGAFIMRPGSALTTLWWNELNRRLDAAADELAGHPGDARGTNPGYPLAWTSILGDILHPLALRFGDRIMHDERLRPSFERYR